MTDSELQEAIRGLYRIHRAGWLDELRRWIAAAMRETPPSGMRGAAWLDVAVFSDEVAGLLQVPKERCLKAACQELLPNRERIVLEEIRAFIRWLDGQAEGGESVDSMMLALAAETGFMTAADFDGQRESAKQSAYKPAPSCERLRIIRDGA